MSELKAKHVVDVYDEYSSDPYKESQVYLKSEADKVIAELKHQRDGAFGLTNLGLTLDDLTKMARKEIDRQKYKRCLALADYAEAASCYHATLANGFWLLRNDLKKRDDERRIAKRWDKWQNRWLAIAENGKKNAKMDELAGTLVDFLKTLKIAVEKEAK